MAGRGEGALFAEDMMGAMLKAFELFQSGKAEEAAALGEKIYEGTLTYYGAAHTQTRNALENLVMYCREAGQEEKAAQYEALLSE